MRLLFTCLSILIFLGSPGAIAKNSGKPPPFVTEQDLPKLSRLCQDKILERQGAIKKRWERIFGKDWLHLHHYCWAVIAQKNAYLETNKSKQKFFLLRAIDHYDYTIGHVSSTCKILPEIWGRKGQVLESMGKTSDALQAYNKSLEKNPKYVPAYIALANLLKSLGNVEEAKSILKTGLRAVPNSKALQQHLSNIP